VILSFDTKLAGRRSRRRVHEGKRETALGHTRTLPIFRTRFDPRVSERYAWLQSPWTIAAAVFLLYGIWLAVVFAGGYDARDSIILGRKWVLTSHASSVIKYDRTYTYVENGSGYDGQFFYYIAADPLQARHYMDDPTYRYSKILYPAAARVLALGKASLVPYTLLLVNWLAVAGGTLALGAWLRRKRVSPWFALTYALCPGTFVAFERDLTEPLSYALIALAIYLYDFGGRHRYGWAALAFALALLTRDKAAIFATVYGCALLFRGIDWKRVQMQRATMVRNVMASVAFIVATGVPLLLWKYVLHLWLRSATTAATVVGVQTAYQAAPLSGELSASIPTATKVMYAFVIFIPAAICGAMAVWALLRRVWGVEVVALLILTELSTVTLNPGYFVDVYGALRVTVGVILAATYCIPVFDRLTTRNRLWFYAGSAGWLSLSVGALLISPTWILTGRM
jgi:hypothetical protein